MGSLAIDTAESSDHELLARYAEAADQACFTELVRRHADLVYGVCQRVLGDPQGADDATQATFLVLMRKAASIRPPTPLASWLFRVAEYAARDLRRERGRRQRREREAMVNAADTARDAGWDEARPHLDAALAELTRAQRDVVVLRFLRGLSREDIARELGCPERTVQTRLARGLDRLRELFRQRGVTMSASVLASTLADLPMLPAPAATTAHVVAACVGKGTASAAAVATAQAAAGAVTAGPLSGLSGLVAVIAVVGGLALAGAFAYGARVRAPAMVIVAVTDDLQRVIDAHPPGTTYRLAAGVHRLQSAAPKTGDVITGESGAVMSGARVLADLTRVGAHWVARGQTQESGTDGGFEPGREASGHREDVFLDGRLLVHVGDAAAVAAGSWWFDYAADEIHIGDDPTGHLVETSVTTDAFHGDARDVTIRGLIIEDYATPTHFGAILAGGAIASPTSGWVVEDCELRGNHYAGIRIGDGMRIAGNRIHGNGALGIAGMATRAVIADNDIWANNVAGYEPGWGGGGIKLDGAASVAITGNHVHDNHGAGLWIDSHSHDVCIVGNRVSGNLVGIQCKTSERAAITGNAVDGNGVGADAWLFGAQICVYDGVDADVGGNTVVVSERGGNGITLIASKDPGAPLAVRNRIHDNVVIQLGAKGLSGGGSGDPEHPLEGSNRFDGNAYHLPDLAAPSWNWQAQVGWEGFRALGQETHGTVDTAVPRGAELEALLRTAGIARRP